MKSNKNIELSAHEEESKNAEDGATIAVDDEESAGLVSGTSTGKTESTTAATAGSGAKPQSALAAAAASHSGAGGAFSGSAAAAICFWLMMSCSVILFNKYLYNGPFPYPISLTSIHMLFASVTTLTLRFLGYIESPTLSRAVYLRAVVPIGVLYATSLATSNLGAARLSVSFVQMIKALTPLVTLGISILAKVETGSREQIIIVGLMCAGVIVASYGELLWNTLGVIFQVTSVAAEGSRLVATQILLQQHLPKSNPLVSISIFAPPCFLLLLPLALIFEPGSYASLAEPSVAFIVLINTLTAFCLNLAVVILVQRTSGLVLTLAGIVKDIMLIIASIFIFANPVTPIQVLGYALALIGLNMYNEFKAAKGKAASGAAEPPTLTSLFKTAVTNKQALFIYAGAAALLLLSAHSISAYEESSNSKSSSTSGGDEDEAPVDGEHAVSTLRRVRMVLSMDDWRKMW